LFFFSWSVITIFEFWIDFDHFDIDLCTLRNHREDEKNANEKPEGGRWIPGWNSHSNCWWMALDYRDIKLWIIFLKEIWLGSLNTFFSNFFVLMA
jgi:hypothetical protein